MLIYYTGKFRSSYKKLSNLIRTEAEVKEIIFRKNPFDPILKTHKLTGKFKGFWSFSIDRKHRIIFEFKGKKEVVFHITGTHQVYKK
ncbi:MAG: Plasmid stabilization system [Candidatus Woesebacteria bacterium GW2011_GWC1_38_13]|uniref:Plasmid stabilization system n=2 Tax=Candidatus Woeseibacteriota TaxID=1752722 RepID=A0A0G0KW60_9BACT|nr:MAG: Plasmid stabilization system [Candidatus Woesebacteria bacterium GW2011_GWC1_38_13]KKQ83918.1 MAG: Plasmid stabilization system [Candidatus Woesebacteria bacterium GW2011_GWA1_38_8]